MSEKEKTGVIFDYDRLEETVDSLTRMVAETEDIDEMSEERLEATSEVVANQWTRRFEEMEDAAVEEMTEDIRDMIEMAGIMGEPTTVETEEPVENEKEEITQEKAIEETVDEEDEAILEMNDGVEIDDSYGVETIVIGDYEINLDGRTDGVHKQALYVAEQTGIVDDHGLEMSDLKQARSRLKEKGNFTTDNGDLVEDIPEEAKEKIEEKLIEFGYFEDSEETGSPEHNETGNNNFDEDYRFTDNELVVQDGGELYEISIESRHHLEVLGALAGVLGEDRVKHRDEDTGSKHLDEKYYRAAQDLKDQGVITGSDATGFEVEVDLPEGIARDMRDQMRSMGDSSRSKDTYNASVEGFFGDRMRVKYDNGFAMVTEVDDHYELNETVEIVEAGEVEGQKRAKLA